MRLIRRAEVRELAGFGSNSSLYRAMESEQHPFPKPVSIGKRAVAWVESEVKRWIDERIEYFRAA
ncbi:phage transcriptional regulator AlpA [Salinisphaera sp. S4-8]|uniref:helix-turn-helix transcriptional regulator n=1 Tax=Salinisphaera sp. S4-8 TaxID=633357 RepID=UPI00333EB81D